MARARKWRLEGPGGVADVHVVLRDDRGQFWGWDNIEPNHCRLNPVELFAALNADCTTFYDYTVMEIP